MVFGRTPNEDGIRLGGPPVDNVAIDVEGECTLFRLAGLSAIVGLGISWLCFRSIRLTSMVFVIALLAAGIGLSSVFFSGGTVDAILLSMPSLVYVLAMSGAVHIINYYHDAVRDHGLEQAPEWALRHGAVPCVLAAFTTALGLGSLVASHWFPSASSASTRPGACWPRWPAASCFCPPAPLLPLAQLCRGAAAKAPRRRGTARSSASGSGGRLDHPPQLLVVAGCVVVMVFFGLRTLGSWDEDLRQADEALLARGRDHPGLHVAGRPARPAGAYGGRHPLRQPEGQAERWSSGSHAIGADVEHARSRSTARRGRLLSAATFAPDITPRDGMRAPSSGCGIEPAYLHDRSLSHRRAARPSSAIPRIPRASAADTEDDPGPRRRRSVGHGRRAPSDHSVVRDRAVRRSDRHRGHRRRGGRQGDRGHRRLAKAHHDPTLQELGIDGELAGILETKNLKTLLAVERFAAKGDAKGSIEKSLTEIRDVSSEQAAQVAQAIDAWRTANGEELWRISARVQALGDLDYGQFVNDIRARVEPVLAAYREAGVEGVDATYTGLVPLVYKAQRELLHGLYNSIKWAFVLIAVVMMLVLRSPTAGLLAMLPNLFPVVLIFGTMGWAGDPGRRRHDDDRQRGPGRGR